MDKADTCLLRFCGIAKKAHLFTINVNIPLILLENSADNIHQRRLTRAIFADKGVNLARTYRHGYVAERLCSRERLADIFYPQAVLRAVHRTLHLS